MNIYEKMHRGEIYDPNNKEFTAGNLFCFCRFSFGHGVLQFE